MTVISIIGAPGVGKSFLVKQLAALNKLPAFFEGELGTIPEKIISAISNNNDAIRLFEWFLQRDKEQLIKAKKISKAGIVSFMDGSIFSSEAYIFDEDIKHQKTLQHMINKVKHLDADRLIIITANKKKISELIKIRGRPHEQNEKTIKKSLEVQEEFLKRSKNKNNVLIIDRSNLDFKKEKDLRIINEIIRNKQ